MKIFQLVLTLTAALLLSNNPIITAAFQPIHIIITTHNRPTTRHKTTSTTLYLEDDIAKMIDNEMLRLYQKHIDSNDPTTTTTTAVPGFTTGVDRSISSSPLRRKDEKLANDDPMRYCADRCVSTGNCDVFEDMFGLGPEEVMKFCKECVLSVEEEPCDVPVSWWEEDDDDDVMETEEEGGLHP